MVYLVWEVQPFAAGSSLQKVFHDKEKANLYADEKNKKVEKDQKFDDYGLIEGVEYRVTTAGVE